MTITEHTTVGDIASAMPSSVRVFERHGIDYCCGGKTSLASACEARGLPLPAVVRAIEESANLPAVDPRDWASEPLHALIDHIVTVHHRSVRQELPRLRLLSSKVLDAHGSKADHLPRILEIVSELATELSSHMMKEEMVLFPAINALEAGERFMTISGPVSVMEHEHDHAGALLAELRRLTDGYRRPEWGCATVQALYDGLREFESAMHVHIHLENNILFPRALALTSTRCAV